MVLLKGLYSFLQNVKSEEAKATMKNGMLEIVIPKAEKAKTKEIKVAVE